MSKSFNFTPFLSRTIVGALLGAVSLLALTDSADAQKAKDTGRIALHQPIRLVDALHTLPKRMQHDLLAKFHLMIETVTEVYGGRHEKDAAALPSRHAALSSEVPHWYRSA